jgi:hypothetical protein
MNENDKIYVPFTKISFGEIDYTISKNSLIEDTYLAEPASHKDWDYLFSTDSKLVEIEDIIKEASKKIKKDIGFTGIVITPDFSDEEGEGYFFVKKGQFKSVDFPSYITNTGPASLFHWCVGAEEHVYTMSVEDYLDLTEEKYIILDSFKNEYGMEFLKCLTEEKIITLPRLSKDNDIFKFFYTKEHAIRIKEYRSQ